MAILGMLTILAYGAVRFGGLSWTHATIRREQASDYAAVRRLLSDSIRSAYPGYRSSDYTDRRITFDGQPDTLELVAPLPEALTPGIMAAERFERVVSSGKASLGMAWHLDLPSASGGPLPSQTVLIARSIARLRFAYLGRVKGDEAPEWFDRWSNMDHLPELVRVQIWKDPEAALPWLDFSVETKTTINTACVYDLESPTCRRVE